MKKHLLILACLLPFSFVSADDLSDVWRGAMDSVRTVYSGTITADIIEDQIWASAEPNPFPNYPAVNDSCWMMVLTADTTQVCDTTYQRELKDWYMFVKCYDKVKSTYQWKRVRCYPKE